MTTEVSIRGAGIVGQVLALLLARARIRTRLVCAERAPDAKPDLRSYAMNARSWQLLVDLRVWPQSAVAVDAMTVWGDAQGKIEFVGKEQPLAWIVDAQALQDNLAQAIRYTAEVEVAAQGGDLLDAPLTVICEGRASASRDAVHALYQRFAYAHSALAAHIESDQPHANTARQWMRAGEICALLPRTASQAGNSVALVWSAGHERARDLMAMPSQEFEQALQEFTQGQLGRLRLMSERSCWPLAIAQAQHWCGTGAAGAWVLAGDAAHAMHPLAGQGLNLGLGDAAALAQALAQKPYFRSCGDMRLLRMYERQRKAEAAKLLLGTDGIYHLFNQTDPTWQTLRNWAMSAVNGVEPLKAWLMQQARGQR